MKYPYNYTSTRGIQFIFTLDTDLVLSISLGWLKMETSLPNNYMQQVNCYSLRPFNLSQGFILLIWELSLNQFITQPKSWVGNCALENKDPLSTRIVNQSLIQQVHASIKLLPLFRANTQHSNHSKHGILDHPSINQQSWDVKLL